MESVSCAVCRRSRLRHLREDLVADVQCAVLMHVHAERPVTYWVAFVSAVARSLIRQGERRGRREFGVVDIDAFADSRQRLSFDDLCSGSALRVPLRGATQRLVVEAICLGISCEELAVRKGCQAKELRRIATRIADGIRGAARES